MTNAYLNYPNSRMTIHADRTCLQIGKSGKQGQRVMGITRNSFAAAISQLDHKSFQLGSSAPVNDLWLTIDFGDLVFEEAVADYVLRLLRQRYSPLQGVQIKRHCEN